MKKHTCLLTIFTLLATPILASDTNRSPVELANLVGALTWCQGQDGLDQKIIKDKLKASQERLNDMIKENIITREETLLITNRVAEHGYFIGNKLSQEKCYSLLQNYDSYLESSAWELITSNQGNFAIEMPKKPKFYREIFVTEKYQFNWSVYDLVITTKDNPQLTKGEYYLVAYLDLSDAYLQSHPHTQIFDNVAKYIYLTLLEEGETIDLKKTQSFSIGEVKGKAFWAKVYGRDLVLITYLYGNRLYGNLILSGEEKNFQRFLSSFEILSPK
jgi:hypothetical protein